LYFLDHASLSHVLTFRPSAVNDHLVHPGGKVRLYVEAALAGDARIEASTGQAHYLLHVMRAHLGDRVSLFNGRDGEWLGRLAETGKHRCTLVCEAQTRLQQNTPDLWLCFAPIKKMPADYLAQKATELGVSVLQPVITRRTIVTRVNTQRMRANAIEAAEQSDRLTVPEVRKPQSLEKLLTEWPKERRIVFADEGGEASPVAKALSDSSYPSWGVLIGPEGGFDAHERERIRSHSCVTPVSLGPRILRADTAALAAVSIWQTTAGDWR
jgi:16S rRNA (uracil1498-N3)-methyltransferase